MAWVLRNYRDVRPNEVNGNFDIKKISKQPKGVVYENIECDAKLRQKFQSV